MDNKKYKSAEQYARNDISKSMMDDPDYNPNVADRYTIIADEVFTKRSRKLNQELNLHKLNKGKNRIKKFNDFNN